MNTSTIITTNSYEDTNRLQNYYSNFSISKQNAQKFNTFNAFTGPNFNKNTNPTSNNQSIQNVLVSEISNIIQYLIHENTQIAEKLSTQNLYLMNHMENLNKIISLKFNRNHQNQNNQQRPQNTKNNQNYKNSHNQRKHASNNEKNLAKHHKNRQRRMQNIKKEHEYHQNDNTAQQDPQQSPTVGLTKHQNIIKLSESIVSKQTKKKINLRPTQMILQGENQKKIYLPIKGAMNYEKANWISEQHFVLNFLQSYLRKNIKRTPEHPQNVIQKKDVIHLYLQWRKCNNIQNDIYQASIQQIITHEMKAMFRCECNTKSYMGLMFNLQQQPKYMANGQQTSKKDNSGTDNKKAQLKSSSLINKHLEQIVQEQKASSNLEKGNNIQNEMSQKSRIKQSSQINGPSKQINNSNTINLNNKDFNNNNNKDYNGNNSKQHNSNNNKDINSNNKDYNRNSLDKKIIQNIKSQRNQYSGKGQLPAKKPLQTNKK